MQFSADFDHSDDPLVLSTRRDLVRPELGIWLTLIHAAATLSERTVQWQR